MTVIPQFYGKLKKKRLSKSLEEKLDGCYIHVASGGQMTIEPAVEMTTF